MRKSPIGIDASRAVLSQRTGTEHYSASLLSALAELPEARERPIVLYVNLPNPQSAVRNFLDFSAESLIFKSVCLGRGIE